MVVECVRISNQRKHFYINSLGITMHTLAILWIELSEKGYYKCDKHTFKVDVSDSNVSYFPDLHSFKDDRGLL